MDEFEFEFEFEKLLNERVPLHVHAAGEADVDVDVTHDEEPVSAFSSLSPSSSKEPNDNEENCERIDIENSHNVNVAGIPVMESFQKVGVGVSWLRHLAQQQQQQKSNWTDMSTSTMSDQGRNLLNRVLKEHNLIHRTSMTSAKRKCEPLQSHEHEYEWDFLKQPQGTQTTLFSTIVSIIQQQEQEQIRIRRIRSSTGTSTGTGIDIDTDTGNDSGKDADVLSLGDSIHIPPLSKFCTTNHIIKACSERIINHGENHTSTRMILCNKDIPVSLDSAHTIYAALIFLSSTNINIHLATSARENCDDEEHEHEDEHDNHNHNRKNHQHQHGIFQELFPKMPILQKNKVGARLENIYPSAFALSYPIDIDIDTKNYDDDEYMDKLNRLEAFFFKSFTGTYTGTGTGENEYMSRLRVIPRSIKGGIHTCNAGAGVKEQVAEEESYLKLGEVKRITRKRQKVDKDATMCSTASTTSTSTSTKIPKNDPNASPGFGSPIATTSSTRKDGVL